MRLADCEVFVVANPPPRKGGRYFIIVRLATADGIIGLGEVYCATFSPGVVKGMVEDVFARHFEGADPHRVEHLWRLTYGSGYTARPDPSLVAVLSGLEIACWDIIGKAAGRSVADLLGGRCRERLRTYTYLYPAEGDAHAPPSPNVYDDPDLAAERAAQYVAEGFTALKFDPVGPYTIYDPREPDPATLEWVERFTRAVREAVGGRADVLIGTHGQFTPAGAKRIARRLEPWEPLWFEEPVPAEMPEQMAEVARATSIPIATGERLVTKWEFQRVLANGAAAILQPALGRVGGILEGKKIAAMAELHYAQVAPHLYCGPVEGAANIQLAACIPNFLILESIERWEGFQGRLVRGIRWEGGYLEVPREPGLGIEFDEALARAHPYEGDELHLGMSAEEALPQREAEDGRR